MIMANKDYHFVPINYGDQEVYLSIRVFNGWCIGLLAQ